jgi:hypothetical protein
VRPGQEQFKLNLDDRLLRGKSQDAFYVQAGVHTIYVLNRQGINETPQTTNKPLSVSRDGGCPSGDVKDMDSENRSPRRG